MSFREGAVEFGRFRTWYRRIGNADGGAPLLVLHGGPGFPHDYLTTLDRLADQREVIFYDQLGCGRSTTQHPPDEWSISLFVEELANLRFQLDLECVHLFGHSWGGWLALEYALRGCRVDPLPAQLTKSWMASASTVYEALWGPSEMVANGPLAAWDVSTELRRLGLPILMTCGAHDEVRPPLLESMLESLPDADLKVYPNSAHMAHLEETESYLSDLSRFLRLAEERIT